MNMLKSQCVFCKRIRDRNFNNTNDPGIVKFPPLNPVTPGHMLYVPTSHVEDAATAPHITARTFGAAAYDLVGEANLITSVGESATQSVHHLHVHLVPRTPGDGLILPWTDQENS